MVLVVGAFTIENGGRRCPWGKASLSKVSFKKDQLSASESFIEIGPVVVENSWNKQTDR